MTPQLFDPVVLLRPERVKLGDGCRIDSFVKIEGGMGVEIGRFVHVASFAHINVGGGTVLIDDYAAVASGARVLGGTNEPSGQSMSAAAPQAMQHIKRLTTIIGKYALIGVNAVVLPGVVVGAGAVIGAGAVVTRDVPAWEVWFGNPAYKIGLRRVDDVTD